MKIKGISFKATLVALLALVLGACGSTPQPTVNLTSNTLADENIKLGYVYVGPKEKATTHIFGAGCLLCYGVASALTSTLDGHLEGTVDGSEMNNIRDLVFAEYQKHNQNIDVVTLSKPIAKLPKFKGELGFAKKDFRSLKETLGVDVLVVLQMDRHGAYRSFSNYIPNGDPQGHVSGMLYTVDLNTNAYLQYLTFDEKVQPDGEWDEPPTFPNLTTSYYQAVENTKAKLKAAIAGAAI
ncbi:hypothetical protein [Alteromonas sp. ASW11-130]|uniref:hypothetical protein n=1 Tax=Alteromonas sp. ASW11-130 TaxID=3015775 RepID=UPI002242B929|nr:hypothetical protein [Alteromonas sp. ASW11-130]MCW8093156.1 hypothetical protein [Alteromonas sp. ASW11-130]